MAWTHAKLFVCSYIHTHTHLLCFSTLCILHWTKFHHHKINQWKSLTQQWDQSCTDTLISVCSLLPHLSCHWIFYLLSFQLPTHCSARGEPTCSRSIALHRFVYARTKKKGQEFLIYKTLINFTSFSKFANSIENIVYIEWL